MDLNIYPMKLSMLKNGQDRILEQEWLVWVRYENHINKLELEIFSLGVKKVNFLDLIH